MKFLMVDIWQGSEYVSSSESFENSSDYQYTGSGFEYTRFVNMTRLMRVQCKLYLKDSWYFECLEFWIAKVLNLSRAQICYSYKRFWIKYFIEYVLQGSELYHSFKIGWACRYARVLNMSGFTKKILHHIFLTGFRIFLRLWIYGRFLNMSRLHKALNKLLHYRYLISFWIRL